MKLKGNLAADGAILLTTLIWGSTFSVARGVLDHWPPLTYLAVRMPLAALVFAALFPRQVFGASRAAWRWVVELFGTGQFDPSALVTHELPLERHDEAFALLRDRSGGALKVQLVPNGASR